MSQRDYVHSIVSLSFREDSSYSKYMLFIFLYFILFQIYTITLNLVEESLPKLYRFDISPCNIKAFIQSLYRRQNHGKEIRNLGRPIYRCRRR